MFHGSLTHIMGTRFDLVLIGKGRELSVSVWDRIVRELERLGNMLNRFDPASEVSRINQKACSGAVRVSDEMWKILMDCRRYHDRTAGLFDITLRDFSALDLQPERQAISFLHPELSLDLGGYAKGYAMKRLLEILKTCGAEHAFIDFGNSAIYGLGHHPYGNSWSVSIGNPYRHGEPVGEFALMNTALSTSGNTPDYTGHIVNPLNGEKNTDQKMICVECDDPLDAEVLTTAMMAAGSGQKEKMMKRFQVIQWKEFDLQH